MKCDALGLTFQSLESHLLSTIECLVATDETSSVDKDTPINAADSIQLSISETSPSLRQGLSADERVLALRHTLDAPLGTRLRLLGVVLPGNRLALENKKSALLVVLRALIEGLLNNSAGRQPRSSIAFEIAVKFLANTVACLVELGILSSLGFGGIRGSRVVPVGVQTSNHGAKTKSTLAEALLKTSGGDGSRVEDRDTIVVGIEGLDEVLVQLLEDKTGAGELCRAARESSGEATLVVVEAALLGIVLAADIDNGVAGG
ncbi:hypothetical protein HG530_013592 [Fusarium avenaceum]|nr:hypothetical protein HG530_013592 [Fusarium avenaceum]